MQLSYWEQQQFFEQVDVCVIGSGIVGLSTAFYLKQLHPKQKIVVVERGFLPYGASTRNAGFACFGSITELVDDLRKMPEKEVVRLVRKRWEGLQTLQSIVGIDQLGLEQFGGYELFNSTSELEMAESSIIYFNQLLSDIFREDVFSIANTKIHDFGFQNVKGMIFNKFEAQIDTGKALKTLLERVRELGVIVLNGLTVKSLATNFVEFDNNLVMQPKSIAIATNGFAKQFLKDEDVQPARAQVIVTSPIPDLKFKGTFHYDKGYYYFRNLNDNRILFGGGRNLDFEKECTTDMGQTELVQNELQRLLCQVIIPNTTYTIDYQWSGIMGVGQTKSPIIKQVDTGVFCAVRMGGMGVALGALVGKELAELITEGA